jgi:hypothetical protein
MLRASLGEIELGSPGTRMRGRGEPELRRG